MDHLVLIPHFGHGRGRLARHGRAVVYAVADPVAGLFAAHAIVDAATSGGRWLIDIALARVASAVAQLDSDPVVPALAHAPPRRAVPWGAPRFVLGADTSEVLDDWIGQRGVDRDLNI